MNSLLFRLKLKISHYYRTIQTLLFRSDLNFVRFLMGCSSLLFAILLFLSGDTFQREVYRYLLLFFPETIWAILFLIHGIVCLYVVLNKKTNTIPFFVIDGFLGCFLWNLVSSCMFFSVYPPPVAPGTYILGFISWLLLIRYDLPKKGIIK